MADNAPVAPSSAPAEPSVANQTNSNPAPTAPAEDAPAEPQITAEQVAKFFGTTPESIVKSKTFIDNSGGYDKVFVDRKKDISNPEKKVQTQPQQVAPETQPQQQHKLPDGVASLRELALQQYFQNLSQKEEYANIASEVRDGSFLKAMEGMGMHPIDANSNINIAQVNQFLEMYSKTKPAVTPSTPTEGTAPTNTYTQVPDGKFTSIAQAQDVALHQDHPQRQQALDYIYQQMSGKAQ